MSAGSYRTKGSTVAPGRLDVYAFGQTRLMEVMVDVAAKHPCSGPWERTAALEDGCAASVAEREALTGYLMPPGRALTPFGVETFGFWGKLQTG